jgi:hypothetical protein
MTPDPDSCPGCAARIPASRPPFCDYCGAALPPSATPAVDAGSAEFERRLAALREAEGAAPPRSGSLWMLILVVVVAGFVLALGCCAFLGVRLAPPN